MAAVVDQISDLVPRMQELPLRMDDSALVGGQEPDRFAETDLAALDINRMPQLEAVRRLIVLGRTYYDQGNLEDAAECFRKALDLRPNGFAALYALGVIAGQLKRYEESKEAFERLVPLLEPLGDAVDNTLVASVRQGIGVALLGLWGATGPQEPPPELARRAEREFRRALELDPNDVGAWIGLGVALHIMERVDDAEAAFRKALEVDPHNEAALERLRSVLEDKVENRLFELGYLSKVNKPIRDFTPYENRAPIRVGGKPLSEIITEERRHW